jgi:hypothetical protein
MPRRDPERVDLAHIQSDLEFIMERAIEAPDPTRVDPLPYLVRASVFCVAALIGVHIWLRWVWACSLL